MPGYNEFRTREQELENRLYELERKEKSQNYKSEQEKNLEVCKAMMEEVLKNLKPHLPQRTTIYVVPNRDDDFRLYLANDKHYNYKENIYLTIDTTTRNFRISQKNLEPLPAISAFVKTEVKFEHPLLVKVLECVREKFPGNFSLLAQQQQTKRFL